MPAPIITVTAHNKDEWSRFAQDAYRTGHNAHGHRFSAAAALPEGYAMEARVYDSYQAVYRAWLVFGWDEVPAA